MTSASTYSEPGGEPTAPPAHTLPTPAVPPEVADLPERPFSLADLPHRQHGQTPDDGAPWVIISQAALRQVEAHSQSNLEAELGGALLGHTWRSQGRLIVSVTAALPAVSHDHGPVHFTFTADAWSQLHRDREASYPDLNIVGWFHTHPDLGVFFSADDVVVHSAAFVLAWHVALVVDPARREGAFFGWQWGNAVKEIVPLAGFYEHLDETADSVVTWQPAPTTTWTENSYFMRQARQASRIFLPDAAWPALPPISPWWGVFLGGLSLLITLALLLERILAR